ncbi:hypothetical protein DIPPA_07565, partial [Diplonema papillatum]
MTKQGHLSKGGVKRPALQVGSFSRKRIRVKKEKAPTKLISNADKGGDVTVLSRWGAIFASSPTATAGGGEAKRKQAHQLQLEKTRIDGLNRKRGHLSKGRVKRPALQVGSFSGKRIRVKKEKAPTKFISNADKGGDVTVLSRWGAAGRDLRGARVVADSDSEDGGEAKRKQAHQLQLEKTRIDGLNRTERRQRERRQQNRDPVISSYYEGLQAEKRLSDEQ